MEGGGSRGSHCNTGARTGPDRHHGVLTESGLQDRLQVGGDQTRQADGTGVLQQDHAHPPPPPGPSETRQERTGSGPGGLMGATLGRADLHHTVQALEGPAMHAP
eukprot:3260269-Rhodomonas_salina.1